MKQLAVGPSSPYLVVGTQRYTVVGAAMALLSASPVYASVPASALLKYVATAVGFDQLRVVFDAQGGLVGVVVWALVRRETLERVIDERLEPMAFHPALWRDGLELIVLDAFVSPGKRKMLHTAVKQDIFPGRDQISWVNRRRWRSATLCLSSTR